jgi:hypothetical protein
VRPTAAPSIPAQHEGRETKQTPESLIRAAHSLLDARGITAGNTKVTRAVRGYLGRVSGSVTPFEEWILSALHVDFARVIAYADPTGESAVARVLRGASR